MISYCGENILRMTLLQAFLFSFSVFWTSVSRMKAMEWNQNIRFGAFSCIIFYLKKGHTLTRHSSSCSLNFTQEAKLAIIFNKCLTILFLKVKRDLTIVQGKYAPNPQQDQLAVLKVVYHRLSIDCKSSHVVAFVCCLLNTTVRSRIGSILAKSLVFPAINGPYSRIPMPSRFFFRGEGEGERGKEGEQTRLKLQ